MNHKKGKEEEEEKNEAAAAGKDDATWRLVCLSHHLLTSELITHTKHLYRLCLHPSMGPPPDLLLLLLLLWFESLRRISLDRPLLSCWLIKLKHHSSSFDLTSSLLLLLFQMALPFLAHLPCQKMGQNLSCQSEAKGSAENLLFGQETATKSAAERPDQLNSKCYKLVTIFLLL